MPISRRRLRSAAVLLGTALCATVPLTSAAHAVTTTPTVSLTINGAPVTGTPTKVSGVVNIVATITPTPGAPAQFVRYAVSGSPVSGSVTLKPGQCDTACTVPLSFDTSTLLPYATGGTEVPELADGSHGLFVQVGTGAGNTFASTGLSVDNARPVADPAPAGSLHPFRATKSLAWSVHPGVAVSAAAGTTVTDVELESPGSPIPTTHFSRNADGSWSLDANTSSVPTGVYSVAAVATDSTGNVSSPLTAVAAVDNGFTLNAPQDQVIGPDWSRLLLSYSYNGWLGCNWGVSYYGGGATDVDLQVDGKVWQDSPVVATNLPGNNGSICSLPAVGNVAGTTAKPLPFGKHTLTWVVTDSEGIQETASEPVTVALPLTSNLPTGPETVVAGAAVKLAPVVSAPDGWSKLASWSFLDPGSNVLASGTGATAPTLTINTPLNAETGNLIDLRLVSDNGLVTDQWFRYQSGWATSASLNASATSVRRGVHVGLPASVWVRVDGTWKKNPAGFPATVTYQWSVPGSSVWHNGSQVNVTAGGGLPAALSWRATGSTCFRVVYTQTAPLVTPLGSTLVPAVSAPVCVRVR